MAVFIKVNKKHICNAEFVNISKVLISIVVVHVYNIGPFCVKIWPKFGHSDATKTLLLDRNESKLKIGAVPFVRTTLCRNARHVKNVRQSWSNFCLPQTHRHLSNIDCLMAHTACLVCFISTVNGRSKKEQNALEHFRQNVTSINTDQMSGSLKAKWLRLTVGSTKCRFDQMSPNSFFCIFLPYISSFREY